jgi:hypothetical protein
MTEEERVQRMREQFEEIKNPEVQEKVVNLLEAIRDRAKESAGD